LELSALLGLGGGFALILGSIFLGGELSTFINVESILIVVGGTLAATVVSYPFKVIKSIPDIFKNVTVKRDVDLRADIDLIVEIAGVARKEGILALENSVEEIDNAFLKKGVMLVVDGVDAELVKDILEAEIHFLTERHAKGQAVFMSMGSYAPAFGLIGTLIGLINMLKNLSDPDALGPAMSVSLITTFYGALLANLVFIPIAKKLENLTAEEGMEMQLLLEGVLSIQEGESSMVIKDKLASFIPKAEPVEEESEEDQEEEYIEDGA